MKRLAWALALALLAGCGGGGGGSSVAPGSQTKTQSKTAQGKVVISIPTAGSASSSARVRYPQFVSPNASSVALSVNGAADQLFDVSATSALCTPTTTGSRNCTLSFGAPAGSDTFAFLIFSGPNGTGTQLASASSTQAIAGGSAFNFTVAMNAAIGTIVVNIPQHGGTSCPNAPVSFNGIAEGCAGSAAPASITAYDPSGAQITGTAPYAAPITITASDPSLTASPATITAPGQTSTLSYSGAPLAAGVTNTVTVNLTVGTQVIPVPVGVLRAYLYVANTNATLGSTPDGGGNVAVYTFGAANGATPVRTISGGSTLISNPVDVKVDASGNLWVLDQGPYTTHSNPIILVFAPGATSSSAPIGQINNLAPAIVGSPYTCESMTFDPTGTHLYVMCDDGSHGLIHVFAANPTANVTAAAAQTASLADAGWIHPIDVTFDQVGNLDLSDAGQPGTYESLIVQYAAGTLPASGTAQPIFNNGLLFLNGGNSFPAILSAAGIAVDDSGAIYAALTSYTPASGPNDANNEIGIWPGTQLPCVNCMPQSSLSGIPLSTHAPFTVALDYAGNLYVGNPFLDQVIEYSRATVTIPGAQDPGGVMRTLQTGASPSAPLGLTIGP